MIYINAKLKLLLFCVAVHVCDMHRTEDAKSEGIWTDAKLKVLHFCVPVQVCDMHRHGVAKKKRGKDKCETETPPLLCCCPGL